ncbi:MAG: Cell division protein ZapA [Calditrichaeota bacterium]|nr:Cell division protein ZapA [Calditrichota bacterium]
MVNQTRVVNVSIFGDEYPIRAQVSDEEYVRKIAAYVDDRMTEIEQSMKPSSTLKVAILAALNIADELMTTQEDRDRTVSAYRERIASLTARLDDALAES